MTISWYLLPWNYELYSFLTDHYLTMFCFLIVSFIIIKGVIFDFKSGRIMPWIETHTMKYYCANPRCSCRIVVMNQQKHELYFGYGQDQRHCLWSIPLSDHSLHKLQSISPTVGKLYHTLAVIGVYHSTSHLDYDLVVVY